MIVSLVVSLLLTLIIELVVSYIIGIRTKRDLTVVILVNICTNPVVVYIANCILLLNNDIVYNVVVAILEVIVVIIEFILYKKYLKYNAKSPLVISIINNLISFGIGIIMNNLLF